MGWFTGVWDAIKSIFGAFFGGGSQVDREVSHDDRSSGKIEKEEKKRSDDVKKADALIRDIVSNTDSLDGFLRRIPRGEDLDVRKLDELMTKMRRVEDTASFNEMANRILDAYRNEWKAVYDHLKPIAGRNRKVRRRIDKIQGDFEKLDRDLKDLRQRTREELYETQKLEEDLRKEAA